MKPQAFKCLGLTANVDVPSSVEEFDSNAKRTGACLEEGINNVVYRGVLADLRDTFLHGEVDEKNVLTFEGLEQKSKIPRKEKVLRKAKDGSDVIGYAESEAEYFERVLAETNTKAADYQSLMDLTVKRTKFDASETERKARGPIKIGEQWLKAADQYIVSGDWTNVEKTYNKFVKEKKFVLPTVDMAAAKTDEEKGKAKELYRNLCARLIKEAVDAKVSHELASGKL